MTSAVKQIEVHRREVESLRMRLEGRRRVLFEQTVRAIEKKDENRVSVYSAEFSEIGKVVRVVTVSELALTQIITRLESMRDVGDVFANMTQAFKIVKSVSKSVSGVVPALENATEEVNTTLSETMLELGNISPSISLDIRREGGAEIFEKAKRFADEKAMESKEGVPLSILSASGDTLLEKAENIALLAAGEDMSESEFSSLMSKPKVGVNVEDRVSEYIGSRRGQLNILEAAATLNIPVEDVEKAVFKLVSEGRLQLGSIR